RAMAFGHNLDTKAGQARISSRTQDYFPAIKCNTASEITERVTQADKDGDFVDIVAIDEVLYFGYDLFPALLQLTNEGRVVALSSVDRDYRNEPIQLVQDIASLSRTTCLPSSAYCQVSRNEKPCSRQATVSFKLYPSLTGNIRICHKFLDEERSRGVDLTWEAAAYYTPTIEPQLSNDPTKIPNEKPFYVAACERCYVLPGKEETLTILDRIKKANHQGISAKDLVSSSYPNLEAILNFLSDPRERRNVTFNSTSETYKYCGPRVSS
ncbi:MAG: hypothetical protein WC595_05920, partial [Candidatus Nanoarchaeia archaeon]